MLRIIRDPVVKLGKLARFSQHCVWCVQSATLRAELPGVAAWVLALLFANTAHAQEESAQLDAMSAAPLRCLPGNDSYLRARLKGSINAELDWGDADTECTGAVRPTDGGIRMRFTNQSTAEGERLVIVFGIAGLREGISETTVPVNVTVVREGTGEFYSTQGDDKCMFDSVTQTPLVGIPHRARSYRVVARGFCTEPARAVQGKGAVLISRFDYAGRVDFETEDTADAPPASLPVTEVRK